MHDYTQLCMLLHNNGSFQNQCEIDPCPIFKCIDYAHAYKSLNIAKLHASHRKKPFYPCHYIYGRVAYLYGHVTLKPHRYIKKT